jgi:alanyl-tRNA synthetase
VLHDLPRKSIDTGAGFERLLAVTNGTASMYDTDLFVDLISAQPPVGATSLDAAEQLVRRRIIADHARAVTFLIADGVYPSNTDRGYVLRFLIRRAIRNGRLLGYRGGVLTRLVPAVVASLSPGYPELIEAQPRVEQALSAEESAFERTLERGSEMLSSLLEAAKSRGAELSGSDVFTLHDTYGFPAELTREVASEAGVAVDTAGFDAAMEEQRERAREDSRRKRPAVAVREEAAAAATEASHRDGRLDGSPFGIESTTFTGYEGLETDGTIHAILVDGAPVGEIGVGAEAQLILDRTSLYAEAGGQIGDRGTISSDDARFEVSDVQYLGKLIAHRGVLRKGTLRKGQSVHTAVYPQWREEIRREHSSAHLLQRALKDVLGDGVMQAGSWVGIDRMRFDFRSPGGALTPEQRAAVQRRVNELIRADYHRQVVELSIAEAKKTGAISMAGEDYGERVRVITFGPSKEFCGGTHAETSGELGMFIILSESSIGSGIRRIESVVSKAAESYVERQQNVIGTLSESLSTKPDELADRVARLQSEVREAQRTAAEMRARLAAAAAETLLDRRETVAGKALVAAVVQDANGEVLRGLGSAIRDRLRSGVVALAGVQNGTVSLFVTVSDDLTKSGVHAGNLLRAVAPLVDGKGGGAPGQAQGGGKNPAGAQAALDAIRGALAG